MNTVVGKQYIPHLHETHACVHVGRNVVKVIERHASGLITTHAVTRARGWASAATDAIRVYKIAAKAHK